MVLLVLGVWSLLESKDSLGDCILRFYSPSNPCSLNEVELIALRNGLQECSKLVLSHFIAEGDS